MDQQQLVEEKEEETVLSDNELENEAEEISKEQHREKKRRSFYGGRVSKRRKWRIRYSSSKRQRMAPRLEGRIMSGIKMACFGVSETEKRWAEKN